MGVNHRGNIRYSGEELLCLVRELRRGVGSLCSFLLNACHLGGRACFGRKVTMMGDFLGMAQFGVFYGLDLL
jgi:hypothetical protein